MRGAKISVSPTPSWPPPASPSLDQVAISRLPPRFSIKTLAPKQAAVSPVENFFCKIKRYRRIATRYEKNSENFLGFVLFAAVRVWLA